MSIAYSSATRYSPATGTSATISHTVGGSDDLLVVDIETTVFGDIVTGVTYNGTSMTRMAAGSIIASSNRNTYQYYLASPATGTNNIVISFSSSTGSVANATNLTGANTVSPLDVGNRQLCASSSSTITFTLTTTEDDCIMLGCVGENSYSSASANTTGSITTDPLIGAYSTTNVNTGSNSIGWTVPFSTTRYGCVGAYKSAGAATSSISAITGVAQASVTSYLGISNANIASVNGVANS